MISRLKSRGKADTRNRSIPPERSKSTKSTNFLKLWTRTKTSAKNIDDEHASGSTSERSSLHGDELCQGGVCHLEAHNSIKAQSVSPLSLQCTASCRLERKSLPVNNGRLIEEHYDHVLGGPNRLYNAISAEACDRSTYANDVVVSLVGSRMNPPPTIYNIPIDGVPSIVAPTPVDAPDKPTTNGATLASDATKPARHDDPADDRPPPQEAPPRPSRDKPSEPTEEQGAYGNVPQGNSGLVLHESSAFKRVERAKFNAADYRLLAAETQGTGQRSCDSGLAVSTVFDSVPAPSDDQVHSTYEEAWDVRLCRHLNGASLSDQLASRPKQPAQQMSPGHAVQEVEPESPVKPPLRRSSLDPHPRPSAPAEVLPSAPSEMNVYGYAYDQEWSLKQQLGLMMSLMENNTASTATTAVRHPVPPVTPGDLYEQYEPHLSVRALENQIWFHGRMSRAATEQALMSEPDGTFLVRESETNPHDYALSVKHKAVLHMKISRNTDGCFVLGEYSHPYASIREMIEHYERVPVPVRDSTSVTLSRPLVAPQNHLG